MEAYDAVAARNGLKDIDVGIWTGLQVIAVIIISCSTLAGRFGEGDFVSRVLRKGEFDDAVAAMHRFQSVVINAGRINRVVKEHILLALAEGVSNGCFVGVPSAQMQMDSAVAAILGFDGVVINAWNV